MTHYEMLDEILRRFINKPGETYANFDFTDITASSPLKQAMVARLLADGYLIDVSGGPFVIYMPSISGILHAADGGYVKGYSRQQWNDRWVIARTVATAIYSLAVLAVAIWAVSAELTK